MKSPKAEKILLGLGLVFKAATGLLSFQAP